MRYRKLVRSLELLRTRYVEPTPGLLGETLAALTDAAERRAVRTMVTARRLAYAGRDRGHGGRDRGHRADHRPVSPARRVRPRQLTQSGAGAAANLTGRSRAGADPTGTPEGSGDSLKTRCYPRGPAPAPGGQ